MRSVDGVRRGASRATRRHRGHRRGVFAVTNVDYIIVLSVLFARRDLRFHSLSHRGRSSSAGDAEPTVGSDESESVRFGYSRSPTASRASSWLSYMRHSTTLPSRMRNEWLNSSKTSTPVRST